MKTRLNPERWLYRLVRLVWSMATAIRRLSEDEPGYCERVAFQMGVFDGRQGYPCTSPFAIPAGQYHCDISDAWCTGHSVGAQDYTSAERPAEGHGSDATATRNASKLLITKLKTMKTFRLLSLFYNFSIITFCLLYWNGIEHIITTHAIVSCAGVYCILKAYEDIKD